MLWYQESRVYLPSMYGNFSWLKLWCTVSEYFNQPSLIGWIVFSIVLDLPYLHVNCFIVVCSTWLNTMSHDHELHLPGSWQWRSHMMITWLWDALTAKHPNWNQSGDCGDTVIATTTRTCCKSLFFFQYCHNLEQLVNKWLVNK